MSRRIPSRLLTAGVGVCLVVPLGGRVLQEDAGADGRLRAQLTLNSRPVTITFDPDLRADEAGHRAMLSPENVGGARVHLGTLESVPLLRIGTLDGSPPEAPADDDPPLRSVTYDLWLTRDGDGWALDASWVSADGTVADDISGTIPLADAPAGRTFATLSASVAPTSAETGRLELRWGDRAWTADFHFADPPDQTADANQTPSAQAALGTREFDDSPTADAISRVIRLTERNEAAIELSDGARVALLVWQQLGIEHDDFAAIGRLGDGEVLRLTEAAVTRLRTDVPLRFGDVLVPTGNLSPNFAGSYGLWIQRRGAGWRLVFNNEPDSWGTQHNPEYNVTQTELAYRRTGPTNRPLGAQIIPTSSEGGQLIIHWGAHQWTADFVVAR